MSLEQEAKSLKDKGDLSGALGVLEKLLFEQLKTHGMESQEIRNCYSMIIDICNSLAHKSMELGELPQALKMLKRAEKLSSHDHHAKSVTLNNLACYYKKIGKPRTALTYLNQALLLESNTPNTHLNLCAVYSKLERHSEALHHAMFATVLIQDSYIYSLQNVQTKPEDASMLALAFHNMAVEMEHTNQPRQALSIFRKAAGFAERNLAGNHPVFTKLDRAADNASGEDLKLLQKQALRKIKQKPKIEVKLCRRNKSHLRTFSNYTHDQSRLRELANTPVL